MKYKVLKTLRIDEFKPSIWVTPVLEQVADGYKPHHVEVSVGFKTKKFVPIEHVGNHRRRILDLEDENAKLRELFCEAWDWMQRARHDCSIRDDEMDEIGVKAVSLGFPEIGVEAE